MTNPLKRLLARTHASKVKLARRAVLYADAADWTSYELECVMHGIYVPHWRDAFWWHELDKNSMPFRWLMDKWPMISVGCACFLVLSSGVIASCCASAHVKVMIFMLSMAFLMLQLVLLAISSLCYAARMSLLFNDIEMTKKKLKCL